MGGCNLILCRYNVDTLNICMKEFLIFVELKQLFPYMAYVYAWIVPLWADQLLPQLLMEQFDTLLIQCRHIEHMHEGVYNFCLHRFYWNLLFKTKVCSDSTEIFYSKLRSAGFNYNLPSFPLILTLLGYLISIAYWLFFHFCLLQLRNNLFRFVPTLTY